MINKSYLLKSKEFWKYDWQLIVAVCLLCIGGLAFLASSLNIQPQNYWQELGKQLFIGLGLGGIITLILANTDYHFLTNNRKKIAIITFSLLGFVAFFAGIVFFIKSPNDKVVFINRFSFLPIRPHIANGAVRWIDLPFGLPNIQPSEIAKVSTLIFFAGSLAKKSMSYSWLTIKNPLWFLACVSFLILIQPDLGTTLMIFMIVMSAMWVANVPRQMLVKILIFCSVVSALLIIATPYRLQRFAIYAGIFSSNGERVNNEQDRQQVANIQYAMQNGGWFGKGYGNSEWKQAGKIYEASTDSIIAVIGEEVGFFGTVAFLSLYLWIFIRAMIISNNAKDLEGKMLATGIGVWIFAQVFLNTSGMTGLIPMKGLPLPFVSQGGTALVMNLIGVGILLNISSQSKNSKNY
jgi:cell division protein FtsW